MLALVWLFGCLVQLVLPVCIRAQKHRRAAIVLGIAWCLHLPFVIHDGWRLFGS